jgi:biotin carboxyl carrier protein
MKLDIKLRTGSVARDHQIELSPAPEGHLQFVLDGEPSEADWAEIKPGVFSIIVGGRSYESRLTSRSDSRAGTTAYDISVGVRQYHVEVSDPRRRKHSGAEGLHDGPQEILAPMPGKIARVLVVEDQEVALGEGILVIEAMKMQNELRAPRSGRIEKIYVVEGVGVETGFKLVRLG